MFLFFSFRAKLSEIWPFSHSLASQQGKEKNELPYLASFGLKWKNMTKLFPSTLEVGLDNVVLVNHFELQ